MIKSASDFLALSALKRDKITVRGQEVHFRELSVAERSLVMAEVQKDSLSTAALVVAFCVIDPEGNPLFTREQAEEIAKGSPQVVDETAKAVLRLSGMEDDSKNA